MAGKKREASSTQDSPTSPKKRGTAWSQEEYLSMTLYFLAKMNPKMVFSKQDGIELGKLLDRSPESVRVAFNAEIKSKLKKIASDIEQGNAIDNRQSFSSGAKAESGSTTSADDVVA